MKYFKHWCTIIILLLLFKPFGIAQLTVKGLLHIQDEALVYVEPDLTIETAEGSVENNGILSLEGNLEKEAAASFSPTDKKGQVSLLGQASVQRITGEFTDVNSFYDLTINKPTGMVEFNSSVEIQNSFNLVKGKIRTDIEGGSEASEYQYELYISNPAPNALAGNTSVASSTNYIEGNLRRAVAGLGNYIFPIGQTANNPVSISFRQAAPASTIRAFFGVGAVTSVGSTFNCTDNNIDATSIGCVLGKWDIQGSASNYDYDINFSPSETLLNDCPNSNAFFVAKDGAFDCQLDTNLDNGISATHMGSFGVFDLPTGNLVPETPTGCVPPDNPVVTKLSRTQLIIEWSPISDAKGYIIQARLKGRTNWAITTFLRESKVRVWATANNDFEYRVKTVCSDGSESLYSPIYEFNTRDNFNTSIANSRTPFKADINFNEAIISEEQWQISPNPVNDRLQLIYGVVTEEPQVSIINVSGKKVLEHTLSIDNTIHSIDVSSILPGFYFLIIKDGGRNIISEKIVKEIRY